MNLTKTEQRCGVGEIAHLLRCSVDDRGDDLVAQIRNDERDGNEHDGQRTGDGFSPVTDSVFSLRT